MNMQRGISPSVTDEWPFQDQLLRKIIYQLGELYFLEGLNTECAVSPIIIDK